MLRTQPGVMIAHDMGTGKSCTVISYLNSTDYSRVLIVCPLSVGPAWIKQFKLHGDGKIKPFLLQGSVAEKTNHAKMVVQTGSRVALIVNYESAWREPLRAFLLGLDADVVVADEIHRIKSPGSKVSWFFKNLGKKTGKRIGLTGTPMPHSPLDIYAQFRFLDIGVFGSSFNFFKRRYCEMGGYGGYEVKKFIRQEEMNARIYSITHRVKKEDVLDLPEVIHEERYCTLGKDAVKIYLALKKDFIADLDSGQITAANALVRLLRFQQLTGGFVKNDEGVTR